MRRCVLLGILLAAIAAAPASAQVKEGPKGLAFYTPPSPLPAGAHGKLIWARKATGEAVLKGAGASSLLLYRSTSVDGKPIAVSAVLTVPKRKVKGGWPVVTWAHGTTGIADSCAPSITPNNGNYDYPLLKRFLKAGYAVVRTDYEGLGTPGPHPYLIGVSEGRGVLDAVLAARQLYATIGKDTVIAGHSQGGQAALFAAALAPKWTPSLKVKGTVAFAPVSHLSEQGALLRSINTTPLTGLAALIVRGIDIAAPALGIPGLLSPQAAALYPQTDAKCLPDLDKPDSFGSLPTSQLFRPDADVNPVVAALAANDDPEGLTIRTPLRIEQGTADMTVFPTFTQQTVAEYLKRHVKVTYKTYAGLTHGSVVTSAKPQKDAAAYIKDLLG